VECLQIVRQRGLLPAGGRLEEFLISAIHQGADFAPCATPARPAMATEPLSSLRSTAQPPRLARTTPTPGRDHEARAAEVIEASAKVDSRCVSAKEHRFHYSGQAILPATPFWQVG